MLTKIPMPTGVVLSKVVSQENKKKRVKDGQRMGTEEIVFQLDHDSKVDWLIFPDFWVSSATAAASLGPWWKRERVRPMRMAANEGSQVPLSQTFP